MVVVAIMVCFGTAGSLCHIGLWVKKWAAWWWPESYAHLCLNHSKQHREGGMPAGEQVVGSCFTRKPSALHRCLLTLTTGVLQQLHARLQLGGPAELWLSGLWQLMVSSGVQVPCSALVDMCGQ